MSIQIVVDAAQAGRRVDQVVADASVGLSRAGARRLLALGALTVSGRRVKAAYRVRPGECIAGSLPEPIPDRALPEAIPLEIAHEDADLLVVNKPAGLVVHPAAGNWSGTLVNALLHHCRELSGIGGVRRPGIVHRLDKGTSGLLVVAKNDRAHGALAAQFKAHTVDREYLALVRGHPPQAGGSIDAAIGRDQRDRKRFSTRVRSGRRAVTHWQLEAQLGPLSLLRLRLETGRTHQIRVHLASKGWPVAGDPVYGGGRAAARELGLERQALHAAVLGFLHPASGERLRLRCELPADLAGVCERLRA